MVASFRLVVVVILLDELRSIVRYGVKYATIAYIAVITIILSTLCVELFAQFVTVIGAHGVEIPVGIYPAHIIHSGCYRRFDTRVIGRSIKCKPAPTADA